MNFCTLFLIGSNNDEVTEVVATATTAVVTAVTTTAGSGSGISISITGICSFGGSAVRTVSEAAAFTPSGASKSEGGITIGLNLGTSIVGTFKVIVGVSGIRADGSWIV
tara:strand:- start:826 stop:1152 length:327 start_codon:yes stop_codon:yes gene_type:complete